MKGFGYGLVLALQFLTRLPMPVTVPWEKSVLKGALKSFCLIGFLIGFLVIAVFSLVDTWLPGWFAALVLLSIWVVLTGGLHLDGLMDVADAAGSHAPLEKKWEIMKDPHIGSFAMLTLIFHLLWKLALIYGVLIDTAFDFQLAAGLFLLIPACSRFVAILLLRTTRTAKQEGLAFTWQQHLTTGDIVVGFLPIFVFVGFLPAAWFLLVGYAIFFIFIRRWYLNKFKGLNGDMLGAAIEGGELWGLLILYIYTLSATG
ncbi:adenosylcobinamide-GDP ribazoletransferase [Halobacillus sp. Marseille-Q1614]|uniref:adenosylcobinamide-GDP ribazoletransferase n=1 Tax=Halobacillus sp. Marseille-Q1614 TaxID=2709134 RepID=UPI00156FC47A|nr:adenosylcobinamide-GDP ribazoletransferase [Halobacillus sp. Marseille-Q1614]